MDLTNIAQLKELGIALVAVIAMSYIIKLLIGQLQENRKDYTNFVESNNHNNAERIEKSTEAMTKVAILIEAHTKILEKMSDKL